MGMGLVGAEHRDLHQRSARGCGLPLDVVDEPSPDPAVGVCSDHASSSNRLLDAVKAVVDAPDDDVLDAGHDDLLASIDWQRSLGLTRSDGRLHIPTVANEYAPFTNWARIGFSTGFCGWISRHGCAEPLVAVAIRPDSERRLPVPPRTGPTRAVKAGRRPPEGDALTAR